MSTIDLNQAALTDFFTSAADGTITMNSTALKEGGLTQEQITAIEDHLKDGETVEAQELFKKNIAALTSSSNDDDKDDDATNENEPLTNGEFEYVPKGTQYNGKKLVGSADGKIVGIRKTSNGKRKVSIRLASNKKKVNLYIRESKFGKFGGSLEEGVFVSMDEFEEKAGKTARELSADEVKTLRKDKPEWLREAKEKGELGLFKRPIVRHRRDRKVYLLDEVITDPDTIQEIKSALAETAKKSLALAEEDDKRKANMRFFLENGDDFEQLSKKYGVAVALQMVQG